MVEPKIPFLFLLFCNISYFSIFLITFMIDQVRGLGLREIGGGFTRHHRAPSIRAACYAIAKPSTMVQKMQNIKRVRGHRNAVYCGMVLFITSVVCEY